MSESSGKIKIGYEPDLKADNNDEVRASEKVAFIFKGSTEKLKTRITYDTYAKPSTNFYNDIVGDPELDLLDDDEDS